MVEATVASVEAALAALENPKTRAVNERHGDDHGVNLSKLRGIAKDLKTNQELAIDLWATGNTAVRLVALLICKPKAFSEEQLDTMLREARAAKVQDWLISYVVKKSPHAEALRVRWMDDSDAIVASAGWELNAGEVSNGGDRLDLAGLLDTIESDMQAAPARLQWSMNHCLAEIGIHHPNLRNRALDIGERLAVLKDYPTSPGCVSPYAPIWINEMVKRQGL